MKTIKKGWNSLGPTGKIFFSCFLFYFMAKNFGK